MKVITLARAPLRGAVAQSCIDWSTGAININGSRIAGPTWTRSTESLEDIRGGRYGSASKDRIPVPPQAMPSGGRWPANMILGHKSGCVQAGTTTAPGYMINRWTDGAKPFGGGAGHPYEGEKQPDESVAVWECEDGCGVGEFGEQSGSLSSGYMKPGQQRKRSKGLGGYHDNFPDEATGTGTYGDSGTASRFFKQVQETDMHELPQELIDYLETMITPPDGEVLIALDLSEVDWSAYEENQLHGLIAQGDPSSYMEQIWRVLRPGAHVMLIAPDEEPTGHTGACALEDKGFEIRDSILLVQEPGRIHYVAKAATKERNAGIVPFERKVKEKRLFPKPEHVDDIELEFAEAKTEQELLSWMEHGASRMEIPKEHREWFDEREVEVVKRTQNDHPCLHPEDLVMTARGFRPLVEVQKGDFVYAQDGRFHTVEQVSRHPYTSPHLYQIKVLGTNYAVRASDNHPFLIWRPEREGKNIVGGSVLWVEAKNVQRGDYTMTPLMDEIPLAHVLPDEVEDRATDDEFWFMFGLYLAEGCFQTAGHGDSGYPSYSLGMHEEDLHERVFAYFSHVSVGFYEKAEGAAAQVIPFDPQAGRLFLWLGGKGASTKGLRPEFWGLPTSAREAVYEGYMAGDGGDVRNYRQCKTVSQDLASQMRFLAEGLGYKSNMFRYPGRPGGIGDRKFKSVKPEHQVHFYSRNQNLQHRKPTRPTYAEHEGQKYLLRYVKEVVEVEYEGDVMNLSVDGSPTFMTPIGMSHNTVKAKDLLRRLLGDLPEGSLVLDPFMGSGSTGIACVEAGMDFTGIELEMESLQIADARVRHWDSAELRPWAAEVASEAEQPKRKKRSFLQLREK